MSSATAQPGPDKARAPVNIGDPLGKPWKNDRQDQLDAIPLYPIIGYCRITVREEGIVINFHQSRGFLGLVQPDRSLFIRSVGVKTVFFTWIKVGVLSLSSPHAIAMQFQHWKLNTTRLVLRYDQRPLGRAGGEIIPEHPAEPRRIIFPMPRFVLIRIPSEFLAAQVEPLVNG